MTLTLQSVRRRPAWPAWAVAIVVMWAALVAAGAYFNARAAAQAPLCPFRRVTGLPCPTCGSTRAALALLDARPLAALAHNPFMVVVGALAAILLAVRVTFARAPHIAWTRHQRRIAGLIVGALFAANWVYLLAAAR
ncbi:MAG: DUF2752 domain-containing protein [Phycisphaerae bacterium]|nr:DUF2752 domain-containing protein [Phycisphaerae bacterium]